MKVTVINIPEQDEEELILKCHTLDEDTANFLERVAVRKKEVTAFKGEEIHRIELKDICYFEVVDNKSFFYLADEVYESRMKLYEFQEICYGTALFRASKSMIINSDKINYITPSFSGRFEVIFDNEEKVVVSRQYVNELKERMGV